MNRAAKLRSVYIKTRCSRSSDQFYCLLSKTKIVDDTVQYIQASLRRPQGSRDQDLKKEKQLVCNFESLSLT